MRNINLYDSKSTDIKYKHSYFPDGQQQITLEGPFNFFIPGDDVEIVSRLNGFHDVEKIVCATRALRNLGVQNIHLYTPYFLGSRSDRLFEEGSSNYLKEVICPIINSLKFATVTVVDPHSDVLEACLTNFKKISNIKLVNWALTDIHAEVGKEPYPDWQSTKLGLVSPDAGAFKKVHNVSSLLSVCLTPVEVIICSKYRDTEGKLTLTEVPMVSREWEGKDMVIVDDICDGGRTFINIAKRIADHKLNNRMFLIVTHGIFSAGLKELSQYFHRIYCTNSYRDINSMNEFGMFNERYLDLVKQFNVF